MKVCGSWIIGEYCKKYTRVLLKIILGSGSTISPTNSVGIWCIIYLLIYIILILIYIIMFDWKAEVYYTISYNSKYK